MTHAEFAEPVRPWPRSDRERSGWQGGAVWSRAEGLRAWAFADRPGPLRRRLTTLALSGSKVATAGLWEQGYVDEGEVIEEVGERQALLGDDGGVAAIIEITRVETLGFSAVTWEFAQAEGEGFRSIEDWRERHRAFFAECGVDVDEETPIVCVWFRVLETRIPTD